MPAVHGSTFQSQLNSLLVGGGYWGLAPDWVPRTGYVRDRDTLITVLAALRRLVQNETARLRRGGRPHAH
ncbi:hypothetical protein AB0G74_12865 [Streptomyces sp. NPDC020875]|uniref:hypothetical protein n=1 Tax=Streptomyces sp. NPDC020875 TaxID=3154898 RepID=UPI003410EACD